MEAGSSTITSTNLPSAMFNDLTGPSLLSFVALLAVAAASGFIGAFALMRRMALASDAVSHIALPGLGIALLLKIHPLIGAAAALVIGVLLVWFAERRTSIATETVIGVVFSASLAIGALLTPEHELLEMLFGAFRTLSVPEAIAGLGIALFVICSVFVLKDRFTLALVSSDIARTLGLNVARLDLIFLFLFAATVLLGLEFLGVLLTGALIIVPAAAAKNLAFRLSSDFIFAMFIAMGSVAAGIALADSFGVAVSPVIISVAAAAFLVSMFARRATS